MKGGKYFVSSITFFGITFFYKKKTFFSECEKCYQQNMHLEKNIY